MNRPSRCQTHGLGCSCVGCTGTWQLKIAHTCPLLADMSPINGKREYETRGTHVALTSSFAGTGGIVEAMVSVACAGHNVRAYSCAKDVKGVVR